MNLHEVIAGLRYRPGLTLGLVAGVAVATAVMVGSGVAGDSVRASLSRLAQQRIGGVDHALLTQDRFVREDLAQRVGTAVGRPYAAVLMLPGQCAFPEKQVRLPAVQVIGVDDAFWQFAPEPHAPPPFDRREMAVNRRAAALLGMDPDASPDPERGHGTVVVRVEQPSAIPRDAPLADDADLDIALRGKVVRIVNADHFGQFSLRNQHTPPATIFVPLSTLQQELEEESRVNVLLFGSASNGQPDRLDTHLTRLWNADDLGLSVQPVPGQNRYEWRTRRIFFADTLADTLLEDPDAVPVLTYFVNQLQVGERSTPYSMVTAHPRLGEGLAADEIRINQWLADDLQAGPGDSMTLRYYAVGDRRKLEEREHTFTIKDVVPLEGVYADPTLLPDFPGISDTDNCADWDPSFPLDLDRIRDKDETYWDDHKGTPKAFVGLEAGQALWGNRWGDITSIRVAQADTPSWTGLSAEAVGMQWLALGAQAEAAVSQSMDFGGLFGGFGFFLILAALLLTAVLFAFSVEQRQAEIGLWRAVGAPPRKLLRRYLLEGLLLAGLGAVVGVPLGVAYSRGLVGGMNSVWQGAINELPLTVSVQPATVLGATVGGLLLALGTLALALRKRFRAPVVSLLKGTAFLPETSVAQRRRKRIISELLAGATLIGALFAIPRGASPSMMLQGFFTVGLLVLVAGLFRARARLQAAGPQQAPTTLGRLARDHITRQPGRSLATIALMAVGTFMLLSVNAYRQDAGLEGTDPAGGTGGFDLVVRLTQPVLRDLNDPPAREFYGLEETLYDQTIFVPLRIKAGDEASCLNLNRAQHPLVAGARADELEGRFSFTHGDDWSTALQEGAVMDFNSMMWALQKQVGDSLVLDTAIGPQQAPLSGALANSMLQGLVVISNDQFVEWYPDEGGFGMLLIDTPDGMRDAVAEDLRAAFIDHGIEVEAAVDRLNAFNEVQNTYLAIFQALGGLALLLGSVGLGLVLLRNLFERRQELAMLEAAGFARCTLRQLVFREHLWLLAYGLGIGLIASLVALSPYARLGGVPLPWAWLFGTLLLIAVNGTVWTMLATRMALSGRLLDSLRAE